MSRARCARWSCSRCGRARRRSSPTALGVHVRTARRVLKRLEQRGLRRAERRPPAALPPDDAGGRAGRPGGRAGRAAADRASPHVTALREQVGEGCHLCVPSHLSALCLVHDAGRRRRLPAAPARARAVPLHRRGKALLAWREQWRERVLAQPLESFTDAHERRTGVAAPRAGADGRARLRGRGPRVRRRTRAASPRRCSPDGRGGGGARRRRPGGRAGRRPLPRGRRGRDGRRRRALRRARHVPSGRPRRGRAPEARGAPPARRPTPTSGARWRRSAATSSAGRGRGARRGRCGSTAGTPDSFLVGRGDRRGGRPRCRTS